MLTFALLLAQATPPTTKAETGGGHNPILPASNELIWGSIAFIVLFVLLAKLGYPAVKKGMDARAERIRASLDEAEKAKDEAQTVLEEYRRQLADAKNEAARIVEEARQAADKLRQDLRKQAEAEVAEIKQRAQDDITASATRAMADLRARVSLLAIELAEKVVERNLDQETNRRLIERFIDQVASSPGSSS
jgi:F-type H+-transporting ATPase subunit b